MAAVACSAGHGTVTRAACAGVGVLAVPQMGDQPLVAPAVVKSGLGVSLAPDEVTVHALRASLSERWPVTLKQDVSSPPPLRAIARPGDQLT